MIEANEGTGDSTTHSPADPEMATELRALEGKVADIDAELTKHEAADAAGQGLTTSPAKPTMGHTVIVRQAGRTAPATVVDVREDGSIDVQIFRADHLVHAAHRLLEIGPDAESAEGWFWPPRV